ncbi:MAG: NAD-dependent DNA ligase LigA [Candidatus Kaelpia imicola]|nr:NAD-dependent DNA ligase LigA [Candidatus Kaelpia imicola]
MRAFDMAGGSISKIERRVEELRKKIRLYDRKYYLESNPQVSDSIYDALYRELKNLEEKYPELVRPDSPTQRVGSSLIDGFKALSHSVPMLSMDNTYSEDELRDFDSRVRKNLGLDSVEYVVELKIDGVSISIRYENGLLISGVTRGDGYRGDDVSNNIKTIRTIPLNIKTGRGRIASVLELRGEVYISESKFLEINRARDRNGENMFVNPRNAAAGSLKLLDPSEVRKRKLDIFLWGAGEYRGVSFSKQSEILNYFKELGFKVNENYRVIKGIERVIEYCNSWCSKRDSLEYDIDGMVVKVNSLNAQRKLGRTSKSPRWLIAYKFPAQKVETILRDIKVQVGRFGTLTPVAVVDAVFVSGSIVKRASLHNQDQIERLGVKIGDHLLIQKSGEIIPQVVEVLKKKRRGRERSFKMPSECPICGGSVRRLKGEVALRCLNSNCLSKLKNSIKLFVSRDAMDISGVGESLAAQLVQSGMVRDYGDLYSLKREELSSLDRMGDTSAGNIIASLKKSKSQPLSRLIYALGIRHAGLHTSEVLADNFSSLDGLRAASFQELSNIDEVGPKIAESIINFFSESINKKVIYKLKKAGLNLRSKRAKSDTLKGKRFIITGTLKGFSRKEAENAVKLNGGRILSTVSSKTDFLVVGENPGSKLKKAKELKVKIITEDDFNRVLVEEKMVS